MKGNARLRPHGLDSLAFIVRRIKPSGSARDGGPEGYRAAYKAVEQFCPTACKIKLMLFSLQ